MNRKRSYPRQIATEPGREDALTAAVIAELAKLDPATPVSGSELAGKLYPEQVGTGALHGTAVRIGATLKALGWSKRHTARGSLWYRPPGAVMDVRGAMVAAKATARETAAQVVSGRTIRAADDLRALAPTVVPPILVETLALALDQTAKPADRLRASEMLLERILGKPTQHVEMEVCDVRKLSTRELEAMLTADGVFEVPS